MKPLHLTALLAALLIVAFPGRILMGQAGVPFVALGDSIGESVQSADASEHTQPFSVMALVARQVSAPFPLPLIRTNWFGDISSTSGRTRIDPLVRSPNLSVSGADVGSVLRDRADALTTGAINSETDLVLFPRLGSQIEVAESLHPAVVAVWIGNNNALGAVTAFDALNASQLTPVAEFEADFIEIAQRLDAMGSKVVFGTLPDVSHIAILLDNTELTRLLGYDPGLPAGSWTTLPTMVLMKLGVLGGSVLADPDYVLDSAEAAIIGDRIDAFNDVIRNVAASRGMAVADLAPVYDYLVATPFSVAGIPLTTSFLGGLFSLDGVHPSNIGHAIAATLFIDALNAKYGLAIPQIDGWDLLWTLYTDPFVDKDGDGKVTGRFGAGLLETLAPLLGFSGDLNDFSPDAASATTTAALQEEYERQTGRSVKKSTRAEHLDTVREMFGLKRFRKK